MPRRHPLHHPRPSRTTNVTAPRVSVVIPTFNEAKNLPHVFSLLPADLHEVILVDGRSVDDTVAVARRLRPDVRIVRQNRRGKGNAMACGFAAVTGDIVVMLDADGSADPGEIPLYVQALLAGADFAKGTRFAPGGGSADITPMRAWGNGWLNRAANLLFGTRYTDLCYGYNAFWATCLPALELDAGGPGIDQRLWGDGFEIETLINTRIAKARLRITEVPATNATASTARATSTPGATDSAASAPSSSIDSTARASPPRSLPTARTPPSFRRPARTSHCRR